MGPMLAVWFVAIVAGSAGYMLGVETEQRRAAGVAEAQDAYAKQWEKAFYAQKVVADQFKTTAQGCIATLFDSNPTKAETNKVWGEYQR